MNKSKWMITGVVGMALVAIGGIVLMFMRMKN